MSAHQYYRDRCTLRCTRLLASNPWAVGGINEHDADLQAHVDDYTHCGGQRGVCGPPLVREDSSWTPGVVYRRSAGGPLDEHAWRTAVAKSRQLRAPSHDRPAGAPHWAPSPYESVARPAAGAGAAHDVAAAGEHDDVLGAVRAAGGCGLRAAPGQVQSAAGHAAATRRSRSSATFHQSRSSRSSRRSVTASARRAAAHCHGTSAGSRLDCMRGQGYCCCRFEEVPAVVQVDSAIRTLRVQQFVADFPEESAAVAQTARHRHHAASAAAAARQRTAVPPPPVPSSPSRYLLRETLPRRGVPTPSEPPAVRPPASQGAEPPQSPHGAPTHKPQRHDGPVEATPTTAAATAGTTLGAGAASHRRAAASVAAGSAEATAAAVRSATQAAASAAGVVARSGAAAGSGVSSAIHRHGAVPWPALGAPLLPVHDPELCLSLCETFTQELKRTQRRIQSQLLALGPGDVSAACTCGCTCVKA